MSETDVRSGSDMGGQLGVLGSGLGSQWYPTTVCPTLLLGNCDQNHLGIRERAPGLYFPVTVHHGGKSAQKPGGRTWACLPGNGTTHSGLEPPTLTTNQEHVPQTCLQTNLMEAFSSVEVPSSPMTLAYIELTKQTSKQAKRLTRWEKTVAC